MRPDGKGEIDQERGKCQEQRGIKSEILVLGQFPAEQIGQGKDCCPSQGVYQYDTLITR